jgi:hypothetical protein
MLTYAHVCSRMRCWWSRQLLVESSESCEEGEAWSHHCTDVCSRMLTYAHVCSRMLTYAHVCRSQHCTWQLPIFVKGGALMYAQVQTTTVQPLIVGTLNGSKLVSTVAKDGSGTPLCSRMRTYAHVCSRMRMLAMRMYAHVCFRMLTHALNKRLIAHKF